MSSPEVRRLIRQWDREIDDQQRAETAGREKGPWRIVSWFALWLVWLAVLVTIVELLRPLRW
ncbi:MAG TPA: hypothetical protein VGG57_07895 [Stellaceae bacterium]